jgi:hypothetical protein
LNSRIGAIAQLGERVNGIHEVGGSTPPGSTIRREATARQAAQIEAAFLLYARLLTNAVSALHDAKKAGRTQCKAR